MRLTWDRETGTLAGGAGLALACGLLLGGAMHPNLGDDGRPAGPQQIAGWAGVRSTGPFDPGASYATYGAAGQVPDYVMGTDWKKTMASPDERAAASPPRREAVRDAPDDDASPDWAQPVTRAAYADDPPAPRGRYPSLGPDGGPPDPEDEAPADTG